MSDIAKIILWLIIAILVILASIIKLKLNPVIGLIFGSLIMGIGCNLGLVETVSNIGTGFGNLLAGIGLPIAWASYWASCWKKAEARVSLPRRW